MGCPVNLKAWLHARERCYRRHHVYAITPEVGGEKNGRILESAERIQAMRTRIICHPENVLLLDAVKIKIYE